MTRMTRILKIAFGNFIFRHLKIFEYSKIAAEGSKKIRVIRVIRVPKNPRHPRHPRSKKSASSASSAFQKIRVIRVIRVPKKNPRHPRHPRSQKKIRVPTRVPKKSAFLPAFPPAFQKKIGRQPYGGAQHKTPLFNVVMLFHLFRFFHLLLKVGI
jgi:hypothetical protein